MNLSANLSDQDPESKGPQRGIYLLPNLLTTAALFSGFYAIVAAMKGHFEVAAIAIIVAMVADGLDGRVARMTNTQSPFGAQYDSLSDMIAFGLAPSLTMYSWSLHTLGKVGWLVAFLYTAAAALRLARFNTQVETSHTYFQGLSSTSAAGCMASAVWMGTTYDMAGLDLALPIGIITILLASLMVSSFRYSSFKSVDFKGRVPFISTVVVVCIITAIALEPAEMLFAIFFLYMLSGPVGTVWQLHKKRKGLRRR